MHHGLLGSLVIVTGGGRGIRTPGTVSRTVVFKTTRFNRSRIPPSCKINKLRLHNCAALSCYCTIDHPPIFSFHGKHPRLNPAKPASKAADGASHRKQDRFFHSVLSHNGNG